jgi:hypothetical protein
MATAFLDQVLDMFTTTPASRARAIESLHAYFGQEPTALMPKQVALYFALYAGARKVFASPAA